MNFGILTFDSGTALDRLRIVGNTPDAIGTSGVIQELAIALSEWQTPLRRAYALGQVRGCLVGFGVEDAMTVREAETVFYAEPLSFDNLVRKYAHALDTWDDTRSQAVAQASGVLFGYKESTVDLDAFSCEYCERRVVRDLDEHAICECGLFCNNPDCFREFPHTSSCRADR